MYDMVCTIDPEFLLVAESPDDTCAFDRCVAGGLHIYTGIAYI